MRLRVLLESVGGGAAMLAVLLGAGCVGHAAGKDRAAAPAPSRGNLALAELRVREIAVADGEPRMVVQALVENVSPVTRTGPYEVQIRRVDSRQLLGACEGDALPAGQVALCELWLINESARQGDVLEARLNRAIDDFGAWDADPKDDRRSYTVRTITEGGEVLRLAQFEVAPQIMEGAAEVFFRFQVEGAHLAWLVAADRPPRLVAGHPADGLLSGKGRERLTNSGPLTLVARNSFGSFVYRTIPVWRRGERPQTESIQLPAEENRRRATMKVLDSGMFDVDEDQVILEKLRSHLVMKDWIEAQKLYPALVREQPRPAALVPPASRRGPAPGTSSPGK